MLLVADAAPLIFLSKIGKSGLVQELFPGEILIPTAVRDEMLKPPLPPQEERALRTLLQTCRVIEVATPEVFAAGLSVADNSVLTLALNNRAAWVLSDDRLLRRLAGMEGLQVIGTLGVLLRACKARKLEPQQAIDALEELIQQHGFRIGIEVYNVVLNEIQKLNVPLDDKQI